MAVDLVPIGTAIREAREDRGWSQIELSQKIGVSLRILQYWESGEKDPGFKKVQRLARLFGPEFLARVFGKEFLLEDEETRMWFNGRTQASQA